MRQQSPYESTSDERRAIISALELAAWIRYTSPPRDTREALAAFETIAAGRLLEIRKEL